MAAKRGDTTILIYGCAYSIIEIYAIFLWTRMEACRRRCLYVGCGFVLVACEIKLTYSNALGVTEMESLRELYHHSIFTYTSGNFPRLYDLRESRLTCIYAFDVFTILKLSRSPFAIHFIMNYSTIWTKFFQRTYVCSRRGGNVTRTIRYGLRSFGTARHHIRMNWCVWRSDCVSVNTYFSFVCRP